MVWSALTTLKESVDNFADKHGELLKISSLAKLMIPSDSQIYGLECFFPKEKERVFYIFPLTL